MNTIRSNNEYYNQNIQEDWLFSNNSRCPLNWNMIVTTATKLVFNLIKSAKYQQTALMESISYLWITIGSLAAAALVLVLGFGYCQHRKTHPHARLNLWNALFSCPYTSISALQRLSQSRWANSSFECSVLAQKKFSVVSPLPWLKKNNLFLFQTQLLKTQLLHFYH